MADPQFFHFNFLNEYENIANREIMRLEFRRIRDSSNPFELPTEKFIKLFRLNKSVALQLIEELSDTVAEERRRDTIPFHLQVFACLLFFGHGNYQTTVGNDINIGLSQSAVSRIINKISRLITIYLLPRYIKFPTTDEDLRKTKQGFMNRNFPNIIGAIDCTHIAIVPPKIQDPVQPAVAYINRKRFHSLNVQAIFNADLMIVNINARYPGAVHDSAIWNSSTIQSHLRRKYREGRRNCYLLGDSGYPIQPWMLTPIPSARPNTPENNYNILHRRTRNVAEKGFGVLKARFRCVKKDRVLYYKHAAAAYIISSCAVLHNMCRKSNVEDIEDEEQNDDDNEDEIEDNQNNEVYDENELEEGRYFRREMVRHLHERI